MEPAESGFGQENPTPGGAVDVPAGVSDEDLERRLPDRETLGTPWVPTAGDPTLGWGRFAARSTQIEIIPGDHQSMIVEPHVDTLARRLQARLDES